MNWPLPARLAFLHGIPALHFSYNMKIPHALCYFIPLYLSLLWKLFELRSSYLLLLHLITFYSHFKKFMCHFFPGLLWQLYLRLGQVLLLWAWIAMLPVYLLIVLTTEVTCIDSELLDVKNVMSLVFVSLSSIVPEPWPPFNKYFMTHWFFLHFQTMYNIYTMVVFLLWTLLLSIQSYLIN